MQLIFRLDCPSIRWRRPPHFAVLHRYFLSLRPVGQLRRQLGTEVLLYGVVYKVRSRYISQENQVSLNIYIKIRRLFWFFHLQGSFTSSLAALNWRYVNKDWYRSVKFQDCIFCGAIMNKKKLIKYLHTFNAIKFLLHEEGLFFQMIFYCRQTSETFSDFWIYLITIHIGY